MTKIEWVKGDDGSEGMSWNALRAVRWIPDPKGLADDLIRVSANHCEHVNEACRFCYAERDNKRLRGLPFKPGHRKDYTFEIDEKKLLEPLWRRKPTRIFVESMSDAFGEWWPDHFIDKLYAVMALCPQHTFINLSKRPERRREYLGDVDTQNRVFETATEIGPLWSSAWPLPNVIEGTSASNQDEANEFGNALFRTLAAIRAFSFEPLLGPIELREIPTDGVSSAASHKLSDILDWVIVGGESGPHARPMHPDWAASLRVQCQAAGVAFFFKQWGEWAPINGSARMVRCGDSFLAPDGRWKILDRTLSAGELEFVATPLRRFGKKGAGRLLDGREHNDFPVTKEESA